MCKVFVVGHSNPDMDSILSSMLLRDILLAQGIVCECAVFENDILSDEYVKIANEYGNYNPTIIKLEDVEKNKYFLVDHNDISSTIKNRNLVLGIIDHHKNDNWSELDENVLFTDRCSTTISIFQLFKDEYKFSNKQKEQIMLGLAFDSKFGKSSQYELTDKLLAKELNIGKMPEDYFDTYFKESNLEPNKILLNDRKPITIGDKTYESCSLVTSNIDGLKLLCHAIENDTNDNFIGLISNIKSQTTTVIIKENGDIKHLKHFDELYSRKNLQNDFKNFDNINLKNDLEI